MSSLVRDGENRTFTCLRRSGRHITAGERVYECLSGSIPAVPPVSTGGGEQYALSSSCSGYTPGRPVYIEIHPPCRLRDVLDVPVCIEGSRGKDAFEHLPVQPGISSDGVSDILVETEATVTAVAYSVTNTQPTYSHPRTSSSGPGWRGGGSRSVSRCVSAPSWSQMLCRDWEALSRLRFTCHDVKQQQEFTPDISAEGGDELQFQCSGPGLAQRSAV
ncbi:NACHT, LRR and PYD domains-containing protein 1b allele 3-like protein [Lates japonicus]|uniref:NACHT, LRR and PYD domains-containing protein 1b allele 3-like protein n=1 Tax=Lates japonicus TaxID=270547 RepID=A0AAD3M671_LATJO|nr:NACHT, LRR and PYD domains-containing protein 1b allele 3-like protein [Lates japonicus]